jgi:AcrR family transcriptional regulator
MLSPLNMELPVINTEDAPERADAARNRRRILAAADRLFAEKGVSCTSMDAIAVEAGVGKGTLFRRFGDRATLALAVLDQSERDLQNAILTGEPPLGPGADPVERLVAFGDAVIDFLEQFIDLAMAAETASSGYLRSSPHAVRWTHIHNLVRQARPEADADYMTDILLGTLSAPLFAHQRRSKGMDTDRLKAGYSDLVLRLLG